MASVRLLAVVSEWKLSGLDCSERERTDDWDRLTAKINRIRLMAEASSDCRSFHRVYNNSSSGRLCVRGNKIAAAQDSRPEVVGQAESLQLRPLGGIAA